MTLDYKVGTFRQVGLEARWTKTRQGAPIIALRNPNSPRAHQRERWWMCDKDMFEQMIELGILEGFECSTLLGDIFFIPA